MQRTKRHQWKEKSSSGTLDNLYKDIDGNRDSDFMENMNRYKKTRIVSARALQISQGSPVLVKVPRGVSKAIDIAELEWNAGVIPIDVKEAEKIEKKK